MKDTYYFSQCISGFRGSSAGLLFGQSWPCSLSGCSGRRTRRTRRTRSTVITSRRRPIRLASRFPPPYRICLWQGHG